MRALKLSRLFFLILNIIEMAIKIYQEGYNTIVEDNGGYENKPSAGVSYNIIGSTYIINYNVNGRTDVMAKGVLADFRDRNDNSFSTEAQLKSYLNRNLSGFSPAGSSALTTESIRYVAELGDLPIPNASVITLQDNVTYFFVADVDLLGNRLVGGQDTTILGASSENCSITSTGLNAATALFTSEWTTPIRHITFKDVGTCLNIDGDGNTVALDWTGVNFLNIPTIGTIQNFTNFIYSKGAFLNSKGMLLTGSFDTVGMDNSLFSGDGSAGSLIEVDSSAVVDRRFRIIYSSVVAFSSTVGLNVSSSATIDNEAYILDTVNFSGGGTYLSGLDYTSNKALFINNVGITNSSDVSQYYMNGNATITTILSTGTPVKISGTTTSGAVTSKFVNTDNRATYVGALSGTFKILATLSVDSGNNNQVGVYIAKNGTVLNESEVYGTTSGNGRVENIVVQTLTNITLNDYIEIFVENNTATTDITVTDLNVIID